jgi:hypothetical protein
MISSGEKLTIPLSSRERLTIGAIVAATLIVAATAVASALTI